MKRTNTICTVDGCETAATRKGLCTKHYQRIRKNGRTDLPVLSLLERFNEQVDATGGPSACWPWTGDRSKKNYGRFCFDGGRELAHRRAWIIAFGDITDGLCVLHSCDNPPCCNPKHFFLGTLADNCRDRFMKGRDKAPKGEMTGAAKLCDADIPRIRTMRKSGTTLAVIAEEFGVSKNVVSQISSGKAWKHIP